MENLTSLVKMDEELIKNLTEKVIKAEVFIMKAAELMLKLGRTDTQKKIKTRKEEKISRLVEAGEREVPTLGSRECFGEHTKTALEMFRNLEIRKSRDFLERFMDLQKIEMLCGKKEKVHGEYVKLQGRIKEVRELLRKAMLDEGACRNSECQEASLNRCSGCLLVSYCSLQCSRLCWPEHKQLCNREQMARKIRKEQRREKRNQKAKRKAEKAANKEASKVIQPVD